MHFSTEQVQDVKLCRTINAKFAAMLLRVGMHAYFRKRKTCFRTVSRREVKKHEGGGLISLRAPIPILLSESIVVVEAVARQGAREMEDH